MMVRARTHPALPGAAKARSPHAGPAPRGRQARTSSEEVARGYLQFGDAQESARTPTPDEDNLPVGGLVDQHVYQALDERQRARVRRRRRAREQKRDQCP